MEVDQYGLHERPLSAFSHPLLILATKFCHFLLSRLCLDGRNIRRIGSTMNVDSTHVRLSSLLSLSSAPNRALPGVSYSLDMSIRKKVEDALKQL